MLFAQMRRIPAAIILTLLISQGSWAQSNYDLQPPHQPEIPGVNFAMPGSSPGQYRFAVANLNDDGKVDIGQTYLDRVPVDGSTAKPETVMQTYTVMVPYTEKQDDGKQVTKMRAETRSREITVHRGPTKTIKRLSTHVFAIDELKCYDIDGNKLDANKIRNQLGERRAVILVDNPKDIDPYFKAILRSDAMFVIRDAARLRANIKEEAEQRLR